MRVVRDGHFWQLGSIASLATETTVQVGRESSSIFGPNMASVAISECLILNIFLGQHDPRPP